MPGGRPPKYLHLLPQAIAFYEQGHTFKEAAQHIGCDENTLHLWLKRAGYVGREAKRESMAKQIDEISAFYLGGRTLKETSERYGCSERALWSLFQEHGVPTSYEERTARLHCDGWLCPGCKQVVPRDGWHNGDRGFRPKQYWCKKCENERRRDRYHAHPEKELEYLRARRPKRPKQTREYRKRLRLEILDHYGGICECCRESTFEFLALDHIHGGGRKHRLGLMSEGVIAPEQYYAWIRNNGFPPIYRVLCHNCNLAHGHHGYCPHQGTPPEPNLDLLSCRERRNIKARQRRRELRSEVLAGYGGKCTCCGVDAYEFLAIDHVLGGGKKHAMERMEQGISATDYLRWHIANGFPPEFRVLCHNCNMSLGFYKHCPHASCA